MNPDQLDYARHLRDAGHSINDIVAKTAITRTSLYRHVPPREQEPKEVIAKAIGVSRPTLYLHLQTLNGTTPGRG